MTPSITDVQIMTVLRAVLLLIVPEGCEVLRGEVNRVPEPAGEDFVIVSPRLRGRLSTGVETWEGAAPEAIDVATSTDITVQLDVHGPLSADTATALVTALRSSWAADTFATLTPTVSQTGLAVPAGILSPLYADDAQYLPFVNGEQQTEWRYVIAAHFQATPVLSTPMQFADTLAVQVVMADSGTP